MLASTCLVAGAMTIAMGVYTNRAYAIAPGLGLNAVVAYSLVAGKGLTFPQAMGIIVMEGIAVTVLVLTGLREQIMAAIPLGLKKAIAIGIGLFIAFIGFYNSSRCWCGCSRSILSDFFDTMGTLIGVEQAGGLSRRAPALIVVGWLMMSTLTGSAAGARCTRLCT